MKLLHGGARSAPIAVLVALLAVSCLTRSSGSTRPVIVQYPGNSRPVIVQYTGHPKMHQGNVQRIRRGMTEAQLATLIGAADERRVTTFGASVGTPWNGLELKYKFRDHRQKHYRAYVYNTFVFSLDKPLGQLNHYSLTVIHPTPIGFVPPEEVRSADVAQQSSVARDVQTMGQGEQPRATKPIVELPASEYKLEDYIRVILKWGRLNSEASKGRQERTPEQVADYAMPYIFYVRLYRREEVIRTGTAFTIGSACLVMTSYHVIAGAEDLLDNDVRVTMSRVSGPNQDVEIPAYLLKHDANSDLAFLMLDAPSGFELKKRGLALNKTAPRIGQKVYAIGNPLGLTGSFSSGEVSGVRSEVLQISSPISAGSSGGPVLNGFEQVIGLVRSTVIDGQNLNIAVPAEEIVRFLNDYRNELIAEGQ